MSARTEARISISEIRDEERSWSDFTPDSVRQVAHSLNVEHDGIKVYLSEVERDDPARLFLGVAMRRRDLKSLHPNASIDVIEGETTVACLDALIEALTIARDAAIVEGLIEPAAQ